MDISYVDYQVRWQTKGFVTYVTFVIFYFFMNTMNMFIHVRTKNSYTIIMPNLGTYNGHPTYLFIYIAKSTQKQDLKQMTRVPWLTSNLVLLKYLKIVPKFFSWQINHCKCAIFFTQFEAIFCSFLCNYHVANKKDSAHDCMPKHYPTHGLWFMNISPFTEFFVTQMTLVIFHTLMNSKFVSV